MIYLDNAATSFPKAPGVARAVADALESPLGNAGRTSAMPGLAAQRIAFEAREALAAFLGAPDSKRIVFTKNATEALNLAIMGSVPRGGLIAMSSLEHNSVARPARRLQLEREVEILTFACDGLGRPDMKSLEAAIGASPDLLIVTAASNVTGAILPFAEIVARCRAAKIPVVVDGSQAVGHIPIALGELLPSAFCFAGHKGLLGPEGIGALWLGEDFSPEPLLWGGTGSDSASLRQPRDLPDRYEAGTQNAPALAGLIASLRFLVDTGIEEVERREASMRDHLAQGLAELPRLRLYGPGSGVRSVPLLSFTADNITPGEIALELGRRGIVVRQGLHCAPSTHKTLGTLDHGGTVRLSPGYMTSEAEVDEALLAIKEILA